MHPELRRADVLDSCVCRPGQWNGSLLRQYISHWCICVMLRIVI